MSDTSKKAFTRRSALALSAAAVLAGCETAMPTPQPAPAPTPPAPPPTPTPPPATRAFTLPTGPIVPASTSVPVFVGYTQTAPTGGPAAVKITSLADYERLFGTFKRQQFDLIDMTDMRAEPARSELVTLKTDLGEREFAVRAKFARNTMWASVGMFYANGGGDCYIYSLGVEGDPVVLTRTINALDDAAAIPGVSLMVVPAVAEMNPNAAAKVTNKILEACSDNGSVFAILDVPDNERTDDGTSDDSVSEFRSKTDADHRSYGAAYYPWIKADLHKADSYTSDNLTTVSETRLVDLISDKAEQRAALGIITRAMADNANTLGPSGAIAGIMAATDRNNGVWKAPANVSLSNVVGPVLEITDAMQADLNTHPTGLSINAIRPFIGEGTLVWGARTLDGNSLDYRYISVRRTLLMIETSIADALTAYRGAPNTAATWVSAKSRIEAFLTNLWREGALAGAAAEDALSVDIGLGNTMTAMDILEGQMMASVKVAIVRPAEFIVLNFTVDDMAPA